MKTLIEIHVLQNFAPSNLNRDDTGAPKDALFGGTRRARISSQCLKRAVRQNFIGMVTRRFCCSLTSWRAAPSDVLRPSPNGLTGKGTDGSGSRWKRPKWHWRLWKLQVKEDGKSEYLLFLGQSEIAALPNVIHQKWDSITVACCGRPSKEEGKSKAKKAAASDAIPN